MCSCAPGYFRLDLFSFFRLIALHLENFCNFQLVSQVSQKGFDIVNKPFGQFAQHILDLHLGFSLWIYPVFVELFPLT
jgi:hypothetical protein